MKHFISEKPYVNEINEKFMVHESKKYNFFLSYKCV